MSIVPTPTPKQRFNTPIVQLREQVHPSFHENRKILPINVITQKVFPKTHEKFCLNKKKGKNKFHCINTKVQDILDYEIRKGKLPDIGFDNK